jgi:hypothetical protein
MIARLPLTKSLRDIIRKNRSLSRHARIYCKGEAAARPSAKGKHSRGVRASHFPDGISGREYASLVGAKSLAKECAHNSSLVPRVRGTKGFYERRSLPAYDRLVRQSHRYNFHLSCGHHHDAVPLQIKRPALLRSSRSPCGLNKSNGTNRLTNWCGQLVTRRPSKNANH